MKKDKDDIAELLKKYTYNPKAPKESTSLMDIYRGVHNQTSIPFTIKIIKTASNETYRYLQKLKETKSDFIIKVQELVTNNTDKIVAVFEDVSYGTLETALSRCKKLEESDAIQVAKFLLYGHLDLMRNGVTWAGSCSDIQITDGGIKLSWNGAPIKSSNLEIGSTQENTIGKLIQRFSFREESQDKGLLPFPKGKQLVDLIKVAAENASQMSMHPLLKKRDKVFKKKGKGWLAIRQTKSKNEYFDETVYLAVSLMHGFVRVKMYDLGRVEKDVVALNKGNSTNYVKVLDDYEQQNQSYFVSEYSNDGNLQQYVTRLKANNIVLKEDQIQFFLYSLLDPIKQIQASPLLSINTIHIRNIYIHNGIPKLGEPIPSNHKIESILQQRSDVPDFYHPKWKASPATRDPSYDTYSLGILLYKLMYTEYPIFPEGKVHIPTAPTYNKRIKTTLQIFLNEGGRIQDIESKLEVSETVKKQIKENKAKQLVNQKNNRVRKLPTLEELGQPKSEGEVQQIKLIEEVGCCDMLCEPVKVDPSRKSESSFFIQTQNSPFKSYRMCTKALLVLALYVLAMYLTYLTNFSTLTSKLSTFQPLAVSISATNYTVVISDSYSFYTSFNATGTKDYNALTNSLYCSVDSATVSYSTFAKDGSSGWILFLALSLIVFVCLMVFKVVQLYRFDLIRAVVYYQSGVSNFNITGYIIFNLIFALAIFGHYFLFNFVFHGQSSPCLGGEQSKWFSSSVYLFQDRTYMWRYIISVCGSMFVLCVMSFLQVTFTQSLKYSRLFNPVAIFVPFYLALTVLGRLGVYTPFSPTWLVSFSIVTSRITSGNYVTLLGMFPEILILAEFVISLIVDWLYWRCLDRKVHSYVGDESFSEERGAIV